MNKKHTSKQKRFWVPIGAITFLCFIFYIVDQQNLRQEANNPQIKLAEDIAGSITKGLEPAQFSSPTKTDLKDSPVPFLIIYNDQGEPIATTAVLNGMTPKVPKGVLDVALAKGENKITWQPEKNVRIALVVVAYKGALTGTVAVGRSLREVEQKEKTLGQKVLAVWIVLLLITISLSFVFRKLLRK